MCCNIGALCLHEGDEIYSQVPAYLKRRQEELAEDRSVKRKQCRALSLVSSRNRGEETGCTPRLTTASATALANLYTAVNISASCVFLVLKL